MPLPPSLARFNRKATNRITRAFAGWMPGFAIVEHVGRKSGTTYRTPVNAFRRGDTYVFALTYGRGDWVRNVLAAGTATVEAHRHTFIVRNPRIESDPEHAGLPWPVRQILKAIHADDILVVDVVTASPAVGA